MSSIALKLGHLYATRVSPALLFVIYRLFFVSLCLTIEGMVVLSPQYAHNPKRARISADY